MFTAEHRDHVRHRILELARTDPRVTAGALTGSTAFGAGDDWSDIDVAFGIADGITSSDVLHDWTQVLDREFSVLDHFDLRSALDSSHSFKSSVLPKPRPRSRDQEVRRAARALWEWIRSVWNEHES